MKLDHEVVHDLYPLYLENDLSPAVKQAVDEHLAACKECKAFYQTGEEMIPIKDMEEPQVSKEFDDRVRLKMKLNRLRIISIALVVLLSSMLFTDYINKREKLFMAIDQYYGSFEMIPGMFSTVKNKEENNLIPLEQMLHQFFENRNELEEHFNFIEQHYNNSSEYKLILNTQRLTLMVDVMQIRFNQGLWSKKDQAAYEEIQGFFEDHLKVISKEYNKMHHGYSSYIEVLDIKEMDTFYKKVNELTYSYTRFHNSPEKLAIMGENELKQIISDALDISKDEIELKKDSPINNLHVYHYDIDNGFGGSIDAVDGQILDYHGDTGMLSDEPIISQEAAEDEARKYLEKIYGKNLTLDLTSLGFNYNTASNDDRYKVYSFKAVPRVGNYSLYSPPESSTILHLNAKNGKLDMFDHNRTVPSYSQLTEIKLPSKLENRRKDQVVIIFSALTGKFELVFMNPDVDHFEEDKFISVHTGLREKIYIKD